MFGIENFELHNGAQVAGQSPLFIKGTAGRWSYIVGFLNDLSVVEAARFGPATITLDLTASHGKLEVCAVTSDWRTFCDQTAVIPHQLTALHVNNLSDVLAVIVRNADSDEPPSFTIKDIRVSKGTLRIKPPHRGFGAKDILTDITRRATAPLQTIFDVGANVGDTTHAFVENFPSATVHSFEPHPSVCRNAAARFSENSQVSFHNAAVGAASGDLRLHSYSNSAINSIHAATKNAQMDGEIAFVGTVTVPVTTLDQFTEQHGIEKIDLLKIDTQGFELEVLRGAKRLIQSRSIEFIISELLFVQLYEGQANHHEITSLLAEQGYLLVDYYDFIYSDIGQIKWGDGLYVRS